MPISLPMTSPSLNGPHRSRGLMHVAVFAGDREVRLVEAPIPQPGPGQVRVRLEGCGVCASNLPVWEGRPWFDYPFAPGATGHEGWGIVDACGDGVTDVELGTRVAVLSYHAYAEYDVADASSVVPLGGVHEHLPFPGEPLGCAMNVFNRSDIRAGQTVAIVGIGFLGALLTRLAKRAGATVLAISRRESALRFAATMGADELIPLDDTQAVIRRVQSITRDEGCDRVIEATGVAEPLNLAGELTRVRGRLVIAGYHQDGPREVNMQLWNWRGLDVINAHERDPATYVDGIRQAIDAVASGRLDPSSLYTHRFALHDLAAAMEMTRSRPDGFLKALIVTGPTTSY